MPDEVVLPFPDRVAPLRRVRSTLLLVSVQTLRDAGYFERYLAALAPEHHDSTLNAAPLAWIDVAHAEAHYRACDSLGLSPEQQRELGRETHTRAKGAIFGTLTRMAQTSGVTPWTVLPHFQRFWDRGFDGGAVQVVKLGPKDADIAVMECPLVDIAYFRNAMRGILSGMLGLFCREAYLRERHTAQARGAASFRAQWV